MGKLIVGTFLILGFAFYELSGGADFVPESQRAQVASVEIVEETPDPAVTRSNSATLINVAAEAPAATPEVAVIAAVAEPIVPDVVEEETPVAVVAPEPAPLDLRTVAGSRVNMRTGPGTDYSVLDTLPGGTSTEVIEVNAAGWARIRVTDTGQIGWMAERLLSDS